jgi:hypothetical protein
MEKVSRDCQLCEEPMGKSASSLNNSRIHRECGLRSTMGGIGHLLDHNHFCHEMKDPDAGLDFRTSGLMVDLYVSRKKSYLGINDSKELV